MSATDYRSLGTPFCFCTLKTTKHLEKHTHLVSQGFQLAIVHEETMERHGESSEHLKMFEQWCFLRKSADRLCISRFTKNTEQTAYALAALLNT